MPVTKTPTVGCVHRQCNSCATTIHRLSKRKFDEYSSSSDDDDDVSARMKKDTETTSSSTQLQFFVRMISEGKSLVIRASINETVKSIHKRISKITGIPVPFQRLIYNGKQLRLEQSLRECGIENDANLQLVGHLRSIASPRVWEDMEVAVLFVHSLCSGESPSVHDAILAIQYHLTMHFDKAEYVTVFLSLNVPSVLVTLYESPNPGNKTIADSAVRHIVSCCLAASSCKMEQGRYLDVLLEFCKLLRRISCEDGLYHFCRVGFGIFLEKVGGVCSWYPEWWVLIQGVSSFVSEVVDRLLANLDSNINCPALEKLLSIDVQDFTDFSVLLRNVIREQQALKGAAIHEHYHTEDPLSAEAVDRFRVVYIHLLRKMDECLHVMEGCLDNKEQGEGDGFAIHLGWSQYLPILKELYEISKLYDGAEEEFWRVLLLRRNLLSQLIVRYAKRTDDYRWILERRSVTNFESRRVLAMMLFPVVINDYEEFHEMLIDRSQLLAESFDYITQAEPKSLHGVLYIEFKYEDASGPGVVREWFVMVCQALFNPQNALFVECPNDRRRLFPNSASKVHPLHLEYFSFAGRIIALALRNRVQVGIVLDRVFFMQLAGNRITLEDIQDADPDLYRSCKQILQMDADLVDSDALGLVFAREVEELGYRKEIELCPSGKNLVVNSKNRKNYVDLLIQNRFVTSISEQVSHFAKGFADIISCSKMLQFFQTLEPEDLDWMLYGSEKAISVEDWKAHTKYKGYKETDCQISWFWEVVGRLSAEQRKVLLFFWTSLKYLPVEGFRGLAFRLSICKVIEPDDRLPSSHTCFFQLCFPPYSSLAIMQDRLALITQEYIGCSFGTV